jgi:hypothetical protein
VQWEALGLLACRGRYVQSYESGTCCPTKLMAAAASCILAMAVNQGCYTAHLAAGLCAIVF